MNKGYLLYYDTLPDGDFIMTSSKAWHIKLRIRLAYWLFRSIKKTEKVSIKTTAGVIK